MTIAGDMLLWRGRLLDGRGGGPREPVAIDIRGGLIAAVTDINGASAPDGAIDVAARTVLPGLIDAHAHADVMVVDGDPLDDLGVLCDVGCVWLVARAGVPVAGARMERLQP